MLKSTPSSTVENKFNFSSNDDANVLNLSELKSIWGEDLPRRVESDRSGEATTKVIALLGEDVVGGGGVASSEE